MPPDMAIDMRRSKLKAEEAALLAGEVTKPSWQSTNEGIHERVSFEDTIWGFDLAGGSFYKTPLRVVAVKRGSRADKAGIRPGDRLKRINDIETSTLTIQEAHEIIVESGVHLKIAVTAPEDEEDAYYCYEDPLEDPGYDSEEERRREAERARKRQVHAKVRSDWSLQWPWVSKRRVIYRESNCFMVRSKFEDNHRDKFPLELSHRSPVQIALDAEKKDKELIAQNLKEQMRKKEENNQENHVTPDKAVSNGESLSDSISNSNLISNGDLISNNNSASDSDPISNGKPISVSDPLPENVIGSNSNHVLQDIDEKIDISAKDREAETMETNGICTIPEINVDEAEEEQSIINDSVELAESSIVEEKMEIELNEADEPNEEIIDQEGNKTGEDEIIEDNEVTDVNEVSESISEVADEEEIINEVLKDNENVENGEEDNIINSLLSDNDGHNSGLLDER